MHKVIPYCGWQNNLLLQNGFVELVATLDVGPRILSFAFPGGCNPLNIFSDQAGGVLESQWKNRGGHRLWVAPENSEITYAPDNSPVSWKESKDGLGIRLIPPVEEPSGLQKEIEIRLDATRPAATIVHRLTRTADSPTTVAPWALSVLAAGGTAIIPQPALGRHPRDLLPNRSLVIWPYSDLGDGRCKFGARFWRLHQRANGQPIKIGMPNQMGWCAYLTNGMAFIKRHAWDSVARYPDDGCNCEIFSNARMLELETLGPLSSLCRGETVTHTERWELHPAPAGLAEESDEILHDYFNRMEAEWATALASSGDLL